MKCLPKPCVPEKKLLSSETSELGVVMCDRHHDSAVDWSDLSEGSEKSDRKKCN